MISWYRDIIFLSFEGRTYTYRIALESFNRNDSQYGPSTVLLPMDIRGGSRAEDVSPSPLPPLPFCWLYVSSLHFTSLRWLYSILGRLQSIREWRGMTAADLIKRRHVPWCWNVKLVISSIGRKNDAIEARCTRYAGTISLCSLIII